MSTTDLGKVKKDDIIQVLKSNTDDDPGDSNSALILAELRAIREGQDTLVEKITAVTTRCDQMENANKQLKTRVDALEEKVEGQAKLIAKQQGYLEQLDYKERGRNLVVTGVPEDETWQGAANDEGKLKAIFGQMDVVDATANMTWKRIGSKQDDRHRPILVTVSSMQKRNLITSKAPKLKESEQFKSIRAKTDKHPAVRREWQRLFDVEAAEKVKPENAHKTVEVDKKSRTVLCDGEVIDSWSLVFQ